MGYFLFYILFIIICFVVGWYTLGAILIAPLALLLIAIFIDSERKAKKNVELQKETEEAKAKREEWKELQTRIIPAYNNDREQISPSYEKKQNYMIVPDTINLHSIDYRVEYTRSFASRPVAEIRHRGLGTIRVIKEINSYILGIKVKEQFNRWDEQWEKKVQNNKLQVHKEASLKLAEERTSDAQFQQKQIENILEHSLKTNNVIDWESLKNNQIFKEPNPKNELEGKLQSIKEPLIPPVYGLSSPNENDTKYLPVFTFFDKLSKNRRKIKIEKSTQDYTTDFEHWQIKNNEILENNNLRYAKFEQELKSIKIKKEKITTEFQAHEKEWLKRKSEFEREQLDYNTSIDKLKEMYLSFDEESFIEYFELVLYNSQYPDFISKDFKLDYNNTSKLLIIDYYLPAPESFPTLSEVRYIATKKELKESHLSEIQISKIYDNAIYKILLRTLHELFETDQAGAIDLIVFNGWVKTINKATGKEVISCIISIQVKKDEFVEIELSQVDPKTCFKNLKGIGSSKLSGITAIQPIIQVNKTDRRFISSYDVVSSINEGVNLALMEWGDFEHLIREIFEKEFSINGGEVKVTQASRDGGVDAIAFDPDPIRGGKIVIQAKRYTNTVGVSAVRDLYGTVLNEGATKGILVTTSDYGSDAYEFVKNKPLTLMNGSNLLYLLEKHGSKARIDIKEAKRFLKEE